MGDCTCIYCGNFAGSWVCKPCQLKADKKEQKKGGLK